MKSRHRKSPLTIFKDGGDLLTDPLLNKGSALSEDERDDFSLRGLMPPLQGNLDEQIERRLAAVRELEHDLRTYLQLRSLQHANETLFYALVTAVKKRWPRARATASELKDQTVYTRRQDSSPRP